MFSLKIRTSWSAHRSTSDITRSVRKSCRNRSEESASVHGSSGSVCVFSNLGSARALQDVDQSTGHLLLVLHADDGLQHRAQHGVVVGDELCKLLVLLHGQDADGLEAGLDADGGPSSFGLAGGGRADRVPLLHKLPACHARHGDVDQTHVVVLILFFLLVDVSVDVHGDAVQGGQAGEVKVFPPEQAVVSGLAGGPCVQDVVQTQLTEILLLGRQIFGFDDPQPQQVVGAATVVLQTWTI